MDQMADDPNWLDGESSRGDGFLYYVALDIFSLTEKAPAYFVSEKNNN